MGDWSRTLSLKGYAHTSDSGPAFSAQQVHVLVQLFLSVHSYGLGRTLRSQYSDLSTIFAVAVFAPAFVGELSFGLWLLI